MSLPSIFLGVAMLVLVPPARAGDGIETAGDVLQVVLPVKRKILFDNTLRFYPRLRERLKTTLWSSIHD